MQNDCVEITESIKNETTYNEALSNDKHFEEGTVENCLLNDIQSYHETTNFYADIMHDHFEGISQFEISQIISNLFDGGCFTLEELN